MSEKKKWTPPPSGTHKARCVRVIDLGSQHNAKYNTSNAKVMLGFELVDCPSGYVYNDVDMPHVVSRAFTYSLGDRSLLKPFLEGWRGTAFSHGDRAAFRIDRVLGAPCLLTCVHNNANNGKTYCNIHSAAKLPKEMASTMPDAIWPLWLYQIDKGDTKEHGDVFEKLAPYWKDQIKTSPEWQAMNHAQEHPPEQEHVPPVPEADDDIPF